MCVCVCVSVRALGVKKFSQSSSAEISRTAEVLPFLFLYSALLFLPAKHKLKTSEKG